MIRGEDPDMRKVRLITATVLAAIIFITKAGVSVSAYPQDKPDKETGMTTSVSPDGPQYGGGYAVTGQIDRVGYSAEIYDANNGLPTSDANFILGAKDGHVWIGGYSGIIRYDGSVFDRLDTSDGLTSGRGLFEDSRGRIWVGTNDNGVVMIDGLNRTHFTYHDGLPSSSIRIFTEDRAGNIYVGTTSGVVYIDSKFQVHSIDDVRIENERILKLETDGAGKVIGQTRGGEIFAIRDGSLVEFYKSEDLGIEKITTFHVDPEAKEKIYYGTESSNVYYGCLGDRVDKLEKIDVSPCENVHWINYDCRRVWISSTSMIGYLDTYKRFRTVKDLPMDSAIEMVTSDYQGNIWAASSTQGVMKIVTNNFNDFTGKAGVETGAVNATCLYDGRVYIGTDTGLKIVDAAGNLIENELTEYLGDARIRCIMQDSLKNMWIATYTRDLGLVCLDNDGNISSYTKEEGLPGNEIRCVSEGDDYTILVGTNSGLAVIDKGEVVKAVGESDVKNAVILTIAQGDNGKIYAGTDGDGIYEIYGTQIKCLGRDEGLTSDVVMRIKKDSEKDIYWVITSNSLQYIKNGVISNVTTFPYNNNYDLYYDKSGNIWVLSSYGVFCVSKEELLADSVSDYKQYTTANGMTSTPTSNSYSAMDSEGNLYIAGRSGVTIVNINHFFEGSSYVKMGVRAVTINNEPIVAEGGNSYTIPASTGRIQIAPSVLDYSMANPLIKVYLEGAEDEGITAERSKLAPLEYTNLKYGTYTLHIEKLNNTTGEVLQDETFKIVKKPRIAELLVIRVLLLVCLALAAGLIVWRVMKGTVIRQQYEQIRAAKEEAERANSAKSRFLANMSHEIRTPINTIMGMDEMILREDAAGVPQGYFMSIINYALDIRGASESLLGLINDLLDMSKIESGKMNLVNQEYDTQELLRSIVSMIRVRSTEKDLTFEVLVDEMLPVRLYGDAGKIKQVVLNLLTNAVKYTDIGGFTLKVSIESRTDDDLTIRFSVKDTGIGVKAEDMDKLFTAYERLDEEKNSGIQGTGLGLDISRRFADLMGGTLTCSSVYGEGSEFVLTVTQKIIDKTPVGEFKEQDDSGSKGPYVPQFIAPDADVLVVDDNPMNLNVIKGLLKSTKMFVTTAESGEECLEKLKYGTFNVVLLDHMMPGMDGVETMARIKEDYPDLPVYALTANATAGEEFYKEKGFTGYLAKPIDSQSLERAIMKHLPEEIMMKATVEDAVEDLTELPEDLKWVEEVEGISVEDGIKNAGGIGGFIHAINMFRSTIDENAEVIERTVKEDLRLFTVKVHSLKTSARIIGSLELASLAQKLEDAGNKNDREFINENAPRLLVLYTDFKDKLARLEKPESDEDKEMIPEDELKDAYSALKEVIPQMDYDSVEMIVDQVREYKLPDEDAERFKTIEKLLKAFDWDKLEELIGTV